MQGTTTQMAAVSTPRSLTVLGLISLALTAVAVIRRGLRGSVSRETAVAVQSHKRFCIHSGTLLTARRHAGVSRPGMGCVTGCERRVSYALAGR